MQNLLLAAVDAGLGSCWMTGPLRDEAGLRALLDIPASKEIVALTPLGYPAAPPAERPRRDPTLATKVRWVE
jgi:nitroreductase